MKVKHFFFLFIVLFFILGCAHPPEEEMQNAREAVFRAENDTNAALYASGTLSRARDTLNRMEAEADAKRYDAASTLAAEAISLAERAIAEGSTGADRARLEAASAVENLKPEIEETSININSARYSLMDLDYNALDRSIVNAYNTADQAEIDFTSGRYQDALDKARNIRMDLAAINQMVANASVMGKK